VLDGITYTLHNLQHQVMTKAKFGFRKFYFTGKNTSKTRSLAYSIISNVLRFGGDVFVQKLVFGISYVYREYFIPDFAVWTMHFLMMSKRPTNALYIQCVGA
jgi:hypothetical protein